MAGKEAWLRNQNAGLRSLGIPVSLDVNGARIRLRAMMPPKPPRTGARSQQRISTGLVYPDQATEAVELATTLGKELKRDQLGLEAFNWEKWSRDERAGQVAAVREQVPMAVSGKEAINAAKEWWEGQRARSESAATTWHKDYYSPLRQLEGILSINEETLINLVLSKEPETRTRKRTAMAAVAVARALEYGDSTIKKLKELGRGYSETNSVKARDLPTDEEIVRFIDGLERCYQWPVAIIATFGARPHEALLYANVTERGALLISGGKTGRRSSHPLPVEWVERWDLRSKALPRLPQRASNNDVARKISDLFLSKECGFKPYDLRHCYAVRNIMEPLVSASLAAKSMGHSLEVHTRNYQKYFDSRSIDAVIELLQRHRQ